MLTPAQAKAFYDRFGAMQDRQAFYEDRALQVLCANSAFEDAGSVFEFGCGTGRFAVGLLTRHLPATARYLGTDLSSTMVQLATKRLAAFAPRASVAQAPAQPSLPVESATIDRVVATYVLDLLPAAAQGRFLDEARRVLRPGGLLCLAGIAPGVTPLSRVVMGLWQRVFALDPRRVGGCRPCRMADRLVAEGWDLRFRTVVVAWGVATEVVVAAPGFGGADPGPGVR